MFQSHPMILFVSFFFCALSLDYFIKRLSYRFGTFFFLCCFKVKISGGCLSFLFLPWDLPSGCCLLTCFSLLWGLLIWNFISFLRFYQVGFGFIFSDCYLWLRCLIYQVRSWNMISKVSFEFDLYFLSNFLTRVIYSLWFLRLCWVDGGHFVAAVVFFWWCYWFLMVDGRNYTVLYLIDWMLKHLFLIPFSASITAFYFSF